jgi:hypothetical protein
MSKRVKCIGDLDTDYVFDEGEMRYTMKGSKNNKISRYNINIGEIKDYLRMSSVTHSSIVDISLADRKVKISC